MLPFSEVFRQAVVGFFGHGVFLDLVVVFDLLEDGGGVEVHDADDHAVLDPVEVEGAHLFLHVGYDISVLVLEGESDIGRLRSVSFLDVFFEGQDSALGVNSEFGNLEGAEVVFEVYFDHCFIIIRLPFRLNI